MANVFACLIIGPIGACHDDEHTYTWGNCKMENDDLTEQCAYCDNVADDYCEHCGTVMCDMHTVYDTCPACAIVAHVKRIDMAIHVFTYGDLPMNTHTKHGGKR